MTRKVLDDNESEGFFRILSLLEIRRLLCKIRVTIRVKMIVKIRVKIAVKMYRFILVELLSTLAEKMIY